MLPEDVDLCYIYKLYVDAYMSVCGNNNISVEDTEVIRNLTGEILDIIGGNHG